MSISERSGASYGYGGGITTVVGEVTNINDPLKMGRVQVRIYGYEHDTGNIPTDKLVWFSPLLNGTQVQGIGASHMYSVGSVVTLMQLGSEYVVAGALAGMERKKEKQERDYPGPARPASPTIEDRRLQPLMNLQQSLVPVTKFEGESVLWFSANRANGGPSKDKDKPNIGPAKEVGTNNATEFIRGIDPQNLSGAVFSGLDLIKNFRNAPLGQFMNMLNSGILGLALNQHQDTFGPMGPLGELAAAVAQATQAIATVKSVNRQNITTNVSNIQSLPTQISSPALGLSPDVVEQVRVMTEAICTNCYNNNVDVAYQQMPQLINALDSIMSTLAPAAAVASQATKLDVSSLLSFFSQNIQTPNSTGPRGGPGVPSFNEDSANRYQTAQSMFA